MASRQFRFFTSHHSVDEIEAAEQWLLDAYAQFPDDARPPHTDKETIRKYANYFTSYLLASVNIDPSPRPRTQPDAVGCTCLFCLKITHGSHTRSRHVGSAAKQRATKKAIRAIIDVASEVGITLDQHAAETMVETPDVRRLAAVVAYAQDLLHRVQGTSGDESSLALWRRFAYDANGTPIAGFEFTSDFVYQSATDLRQAIVSASRSSR